MLKLITEHKDYLLLVDFSKESTNYKEYVHAPETSMFNGFAFGKISKEKREQSFKKAGFKFYTIVAHLPLNNTPVLEGVPLLPELPKQEEDVEELAESVAKFEQDPQLPDMVEYAATKRGFIKGYKAASKKWSDEDMERCFEAGQCIGLSYLPHSYNEKFHEYLESLSPTLVPIGFEPEYREEFTDFGEEFGYTYIKKLKIVDNILQGTYEFKK